MVTTLFLMILVVTAASPQAEVPGLWFEDPVSLLSTSSGEVETELFAKGFWEVQVLSSALFGVSDAAGLSATPILFKQHPDLYLYYLLNRQWYVETAVKDEFSASIFAAGYLGGKDEYLREVRVGNDGLDFPDYPFLGIGKGIEGSFGVKVQAGDDRSSIDAIVRYDRAGRQSRAFLGARELSERTIEPSAYISGRYFDAPSPGIVELYVEAETGPFTGSDDVRYRLMSGSEFSFSSVTGRIALAAALEDDRKLLVVGGSDVDVEVDGEDCTQLYPPVTEGADSSNHQFLNRYPASGIPEGAILSVVESSTGSSLPGYSVFLQSDGSLEVRKDGALADSLQERFPFVDEGGPSASSWIYDAGLIDPGDNADRDHPEYPVGILVRISSGYDGIKLPQDVMDGSIEVRRNGILDLSFTFDANSGTVTILPPPGPSDLIEVSYLIASDERGDGVVAAALGGRYSLSDAWSAWAALGCRWGVPGTGFTEPGSDSPGTMTISGGIEGKEEPYSFKASLAADYRRDDATGLLRLEGMENESAWKSPFMPTTGAAAAIEDSSLEKAFPAAMERFHPDGEKQKVLELMPDVGGAFETLKYIDPVPVRSYRRFAFFAESSSTSAELTVSIGDGSSAAVRATVDLAGGISGWRKYIVDYGDGSAQLLYARSDDGVEQPMPLGSAVYDGSVDARVIRISVTGDTPANAILVDELHFEESSGAFSAIGAAEFSGAWPDAAWGSILGVPVIASPGASASLRGGVGESSAYGGIVADGQLAAGPLDLEAIADLSASGSEFDASFGHGVSLFRLPFIGASDRFSFSAHDGRFSRENRVAAKAGTAFSSAVTASSAFRAGLFTQHWLADAVIGNRLVAARLEANGSSSVDAADLPASYGPAWIDSFRFLLPAYESDSFSRTVKANLTVLEEREFLKAAAGYGSDPADPSFLADASAELGWRFAAGSFSVRPWYRRSWTDEQALSGDGFLGDAGRWTAAFSQASFAWLDVPVIELFSDDVASSFSSSTSSSSGAALVAEAGTTWKRSSGSKWFDLVLPSEGTLAFGRSLVRKLDTVTDAWTVKASLAVQAVNLFGSLGAYPAISLYGTDEFAGRTDLSWVLDRGDGASLVAFANILRAGFYADGGDSLAVENRFSLDTTRDGRTWSELVSLSWILMPDGSWLGTIVDRVIGPRRDPGGRGGGATEKSYVSAFLEDLATRERIHAHEIGASISFSRPDPFGLVSKTEIRERYEARYAVPERMSVSVSAALSQGWAVSDGRGVFTAGYELVLTARIMF